MIVFWALFDNETLNIATGYCDPTDWALQETSMTKCVVQTDRNFMPEDLFVDQEDWILREYGTGNPVAQEDPITDTKLHWIVRALRAQSPNSERVLAVLYKMQTAHTMKQIMDCVEEQELVL
jgi:hypothetical protein